MPSESDYTYEALLAGRAAPWISKTLLEPWPRPIPGPSLIEKTAKKQLEKKTYHPHCGSLHNPPPGTICEWTNLPLHESVPRDPVHREHLQDAVERVTLADLDFAREYCRREMALGLRAMDELEARQAELERREQPPAAPGQSGDLGERSSGMPPSEGRGDVGADCEHRGDQGDGHRRDADATDADCEHRGDQGDGHRRDADATSADYEHRGDQGNAHRRDADATSADCEHRGDRGDGHRRDADATPEPVEPVPVEPEPVEPAPVEPAPVKPVPVRAARLQALKNSELIALIRGGRQASERLQVLTLERRRVAYLCIESAAEVDLKTRFIEDRATAITRGTLLALDKAFLDLGFGGWMPFRYPDQFLMMTSLMEKLFAANGLITPKGANHWRRFIEDTPEVCKAEPLRMPEGISNQPRCASVKTLAELMEKAEQCEKADELREKLRMWHSNQRDPPAPP